MIESHWRARAAIVMPVVLVTACGVPDEGGSPNAIVRYEIQVAPGNFNLFDDVDGIEPFCTTPDIEWLVNKRLSAADEPVAIEAILQPSFGHVDAAGNCIVTLQPFGWVPPGEYRIVATDYQWTAACTQTLIAQSTGGQFHSVRFVKGEAGCDEELVPLPFPD